MRRLIILFSTILLIALCVFSSCSAAKSSTIVVTGEVLEIYDNGFLLSATEPDGTGKVSISYDKSMKPPEFNLIVSQVLEVTVLSPLRESNPVQATAVDVKLLLDIKEETAAVDNNLNQLARSNVPVKITPEEAKRMMDEESGVIVLDVRTQEEYDAGHIKGALLLPNTEVADQAAALLPDKDATILIYCRSGRRSALAAEILAGMGYTHVCDFGGIIDWPYETVKE